MSIKINCTTCEHELNLRNEVYNSLMWGEEDVCCGKCGNKIVVETTPRSSKYSHEKFHENRISGHEMIKQRSIVNINKPDPAYAVAGLMMFVYFGLWFSCTVIAPLVHLVNDGSKPVVVLICFIFGLWTSKHFWGYLNSPHS